MADTTDEAAADTAQMVGHLRNQADGCAHLGSPLYHYLLSRIADDVEAGGPALDVLRGHEGDPGPSALALRLMGAAHRLVLERRTPALALTFPSVGGSGDPEAAWVALREVLVEHRDQLRAGLSQAPQTNEVGRSAVLVGGLLYVAASDRCPLRLVEIGASAGLNLRADRYRIDLPDGRSTGPASSPVVLSDPWRGAVPPLAAEVAVMERLGCDIAPIDPTTTEGRLRLTSYVWADQLQRLQRLRGALAVAAEVPATLEAAGAADFLERLRLTEGTTTVLWHSIMWQYLGADERARAEAAIDRLGEQASATAGFAQLAMEPRRRTPGAEHELLVTLRTWPGGGTRVLGTSTGHGIPTTWDT